MSARAILRILVPHGCTFGIEDCIGSKWSKENLHYCPDLSSLNIIRTLTLT